MCGVLTRKGWEAQLGFCFNLLMLTGVLSSSSCGRGFYFNYKILYCTEAKLGEAKPIWSTHELIYNVIPYCGFGFKTEKN